MGRARPPAELLNNLRERLSQLPENHPSVFRDTFRDPQASAEHETVRYDQRQQDSLARHDRDSAPELWDDVRGPGQVAADDDQEGPACGDRSLGALIRAVKDAGDLIAGSANLGLADVEVLPGSGQSDPYRPWFMSGDVGTPWFAAGDD
ncbi:MAG: hypothetical protein ACTHJW_02960 [Streptosporangiaceae bacterium]